MSIFGFNPNNSTKAYEETIDFNLAHGAQRFNMGRQQGQIEGYKKGKADGYKNGYKVGYKEGRTAGNNAVVDKANGFMKQLEDLVLEEREKYRALIDKYNKLKETATQLEDIILEEREQFAIGEEQYQALVVAYNKIKEENEQLKRLLRTVQEPVYALAP